MICYILFDQVESVIIYVIRYGMILFVKGRCLVIYIQIGGVMEQWFEDYVVLVGQELILFFEYWCVVWNLGVIVWYDDQWEWIFVVWYGQIIWNSVIIVCFVFDVMYFSELFFFDVRMMLVNQLEVFIGEEVIGVWIQFIFGEDYYFVFIY